MIVFIMYETYLQAFEDSKYIIISGKLRGFNVSQNRGFAQSKVPGIGRAKSVS